jgi:RHS repeat-associated protein
VKANGSEELATGFYLRNAFGKLENGSTAASSMETHTGLGFAGAGTPTSAGGGYVYMRNRWYDPQTGRFLSQDPIGLAGGVNLYAYAGNNPANYSDPYGLAPCCVEALRLAAGAGISIAVAPEVVAGILAVAVISFADQESGHVASTSMVAPADVTGYALPRRSTRSIRREWEGIHGIPWPLGADGRPHEAHHKEPLADGGVDDATNIEPLPKADHIQRHKDNGDFKRWAKRRTPRSSEPEQRPQEGGNE